MKRLYHLKGKGFSGRGVLLRDLTVAEKDEAYMSAALQAGEDGKKYIILRAREAVSRMIVGVTEPKETLDAIRAEPVPEITQAELCSLTGARRMEKLFTAKDIGALEHIFLRDHEATVSEVEAIMGKAIPMAED